MSSSQHHVLEMVDVASRKRIEDGVIKVVARSFVVDQLRSGSAAQPMREEIRRRTNICYDWIATMRNDMGYSVIRSLDVLGDALRASVDGESYEPESAERSWTPSKEAT